MRYNSSQNAERTSKAVVLSRVRERVRSGGRANLGVLESSPMELTDDTEDAELDSLWENVQSTGQGQNWGTWRPKVVLKTH